MWVCAVSCEIATIAAGRHRGSVKREPELATGNKKAHRIGWAFLMILVAWGGIEPPTRGFSKHPTPVDWLCVRGRSVTVFRVFPSAALALTELVAELVRPSALHDHQIFPTGSTSLMIRTPNRTTEPHGHRVSWPCPPCRLSRAQIGQLHDRAHTAGDFFGRWGTDLGHPSSHGRRRCLGLCRHLL